MPDMDLPAVRAAFAREPRPVEAVVVWADGRPVSAGRIQYSEGAEFADLFGGGTGQGWRGRGSSARWWLGGLREIFEGKPGGPASRRSWARSSITCRAPASRDG